MRLFPLTAGTVLLALTVASTIRDGFGWLDAACLVVGFACLAIGAFATREPYDRHLFVDRVEYYSGQTVEELLASHERALKHHYSRETVDAIEFLLDERSEAER